MVTIIKNQLLKHLSRFTKNLSPEQISLSALRGSGELADLTLDEVLLTELLELPAWLRLTSAKCNRATFRIQWTKLKTVPIMLNLDEVHVALAVCSEPRTASSSAPSGITAALPGKYSFIHKVIDGISVSVNLVQVHFNCDAFNATVQISRVTVESRTPQWARGDLRLTRIKSPDTGQLLIFKELEWQTARLEIKVRGSAAANLPPLRLLIGNSHCRIVIKKRLSDCSMIGSRLVLQPEPLAWALTDGQLRAALACISALMEPVQKATTASTRAKAVRKIQVDSAPEAQTSRSSHGTERDALARLFARYDVRETSYHLLAPRIDLHLCDDPGLGRSEKPSLFNGGALQVSLISMQADFFPYHKATNDRRHWKGYREAATPHSQWLSQSLSAFCGSLLEMLDPRPTVTPTSVNKEPSHMENRTEEMMANGVQNKPQQNQTHNQSNTTNSNSSTNNSGASPTRTRILQQLGKLMTTCLVLRIDDFTVYKVSTGQKSREPMRALVNAEKATLPGDAGLLHAELTHFYYPGETNDFPVPPPKLYVQLSPVRVSVDVDSCVWLGAFMPHVGRALVESTPHEEMPFYMDVKMEAIMPKIVLEAGPEHVSQQRDRPKELQVCAARATLTNVREPSRNSGAPGSRADLASILTALRQAAPPARKFPRCEEDLEPINDKFILHADGLDDIERTSKLHPELLWREARDVWCIRAEPAWADFCGAKATGNKPAPLLDAIPLTAWLSFDETFSKIWCVAKVWGLAGLQLNHYQLLFLLRQMERLSELTSWLAHDARRQPDADEGAIVVGVVVPQAELTLVLPSSCPGQESSRDLDSVPLDSSSLQDLKLGSEATCGPAHAENSLLGHQGSLEFTSSLPPAFLPEEQRPPSPTHSVNFSSNFAGFSSMRRGLTSLVTSIDSALTRDDSRSDAASTASSDSERYVVVGLTVETPDDADTAFREFEQGRRTSEQVEVAAEVVERSSSPSERSVTSSCRRRDLVSTCTWRVGNIHAVHQSMAGATAVRVIAADLKTDECSSIPWDELQSKFAMRARAFAEQPPDVDSEAVGQMNPKIMLRLERNELPMPKESEPGSLAPCTELLKAHVRDLVMPLNMSTALALAEFAEDEVIQPPIPVELLIEDIKLHLVEDRPTRSISSPLPQPLDVVLTSLVLCRDEEGVIRIGPATRPDPPPIQDHASAEMVEAQTRVGQLQRENEELRRRLARLARVSEDNRELRVRAEEAAVLRDVAASSQQETAILLQDKDHLLETVRRLKEQLSSGCQSRAGKR